jgi:hypothetical protein
MAERGEPNLDRGRNAIRPGTLDRIFKDFRPALKPFRGLADKSFPARVDLRGPRGANALRCSHLEKNEVDGP